MALHQSGPLGASWRAYPSASVRRSVVERLKARPDSARAGDEWWQLGEYQVIEGLTSADEAAINAGLQALMCGAALNPPHVGCLLDLGWLLCFKGLDQLALPYLARAAELTPASRDVWSLRGWAYIGSGLRDEAVASFKNAAELPEATESDRQILAQLQEGADLATLRKELILNKFDECILRSEGGDQKDAAQSGVIQFRQLLDQRPGDVDLSYCLAYCYYILDQLTQAEPLLLRVIGEKADHADALTLLGLIAMKQKRPDDQRQYYERAVDANPNHVLANVNLASMYQDAGEFHVARPMLLRAIEAAAPDDPYLPIALDLLANSYGAIEQDYAKEVDLHRQAISLNPKKPLFHANLIVALLSDCQVKNAQRALQSAKDARLPLPNQPFLENIVRIFLDRTLHPYRYLQLVEELANSMGWGALRQLVRYAWDRRNIVDQAERVDFISGIGLIAAKTGDHELALEIWRHGLSIAGGSVFGSNLAVELSNLGRHAEALEIADRMSMDNPRSWTILGNIRMNAEQYKSAIEAYRMALEKDERFLLPISNAIHAAQVGLLGEHLEPFIDRLMTDWKSSRTASLLLGQALVMRGKLSTAAEEFQAALFDGQSVRTPEELFDGDHDAEDFSVFGNATLEHHYAAARCFLLLGRLDLLMKLVVKVAEWPKWMNGDWLVLQAEAYVAANRFDDAESVISKMPNQPPPRVVEAKIAVARGNLDDAKTIIEEGLNNDLASEFTHPDGRPDAIFRALAAELAIRTGDLLIAEDLAQEAVRRDPSCIRARLALIAALHGRSPHEDVRSLIHDGLRRSPGHPDLVAELVGSYLGSGSPDSANEELERVRPFLVERGASDIAHRLGEAIAIDRLSKLEGAVNTIVDNAVPWPWIESLEQPIKQWMRAAYLSSQRGDELSAAFVLYVSKVAEYLLVSKIMVPFRDSLRDAHTYTSDRHRDVIRFMSGGSPPSIGAIARLLEAAGRTYRSSDDELLRVFREAISKGKFGDSRVLRGSELTNQLSKLAHARNSSAHLGDHDMAVLRDATKCIVANDLPGLLLKSMGMS
jgi:tetratricopeptide (TPR) repeat protein